jgi:hypothetical protein
VSYQRPFYPIIPDEKDYNRLEGEFRRLVAYMHRLEDQVCQLQNAASGDPPDLNAEAIRKVRDRVGYLDGEDVLLEYILRIERELRILRREHLRLKSRLKLAGLGEA